MFTKVNRMALLGAVLCSYAAFTVEAAPSPTTPSNYLDQDGPSNDANRSRPTHWKLAIEEGGPIMEFNGSLQEVEKQIQAIKPDFEFKPVDLINDTMTLNQQDISRQCLPTYRNSPRTTRIQEGINYLRSLGDAKCGGNGGSDGETCSQISCSYNAAIQWCNMGTDYYETTCSAFADYAQDILDHCSNEWHWRVRGYEDDTTSDHHIRVKVERSWC
ncbi:uncharacterized protein PG998_005413 [Apiospora kogelbergensis]|uniref:uncharacterized protein n=1 Tax=Apiospora kogelbergensis TaxID=1337665 RepID=UPI00312CC8FE